MTTGKRKGNKGTGKSGTPKPSRRADDPSRREPGSNRTGASRRASSDAPKTSGRAGREDGSQVEGFHAVRALLSAGRREVREVWVASESGHQSELAELAGDLGARVRTVTDLQLAARARSEVPQGVIAWAAPVPNVAVDDLLGAANPFLLVVDGVTDPGNLGAILRSADTAGVSGVVLPIPRAAGLGPTTLKAAAGAVEYLRIARVAGIPGFLDQAKRAGVWSVGLDSNGESDVHDLSVADGPVALVVGAEGRGLARLTRERCDLVASIPLHGRLESLNASAAAAVALHAVARRRPVIADR